MPTGTPTVQARTVPGQRKRGRDNRIYQSVPAGKGWRWKHVVSFRQDESILIRKSKNIGDVGRKNNVRLPAVFVGPSTIPEAGRGLFVAEPVQKGAFVTEYGGELLDLDSRTMDFASLPNTSHHFSLMSGGLTYDGRVHA